MIGVALVNVVMIVAYVLRFCCMQAAKTIDNYYVNLDHYGKSKFVNSKLGKERQDALNHALISHPNLTKKTRMMIPVLCLILVALFLSAHLMVGASINVQLVFGGAAVCLRRQQIVNVPQFHSVITPLSLKLRSQPKRVTGFVKRSLLVITTMSTWLHLQLTYRTRSVSC